MCQSHTFHIWTLSTDWLLPTVNNTKHRSIWVKMCTQVHEHCPQEASLHSSYWLYCKYKHYRVQKKQTAETTKVPTFFCCFCFVYRAARWHVQSKISPKLSWSLWICTTISRGLCQHVQLPLKISMQPTSTESTTALQQPVLLVSSRSSAHPSTIIAHLPFHLQHLTLADKDEDERTVRVKGSSLNLIKINFTMSFDCDSLHVTLMSYSAWLGFMNTRVEWSQNCDLPANYVFIKFSKAVCSISNTHKSPCLNDLYTHNA